MRRRNTTYYEYQRIAAALKVPVKALLHHPQRHAYRTHRIRGARRTKILPSILEHEAHRIDLLSRAAMLGIPLPPMMEARLRKLRQHHESRRGWGRGEWFDLYAMPGRWR